ncbi:MAG TPA: divalent-cation tolerance protein CutA [Thermoplasmata archaeon]|nr:divalent-cation tolerance protein CutA [Thermoplasmata archaeon]
MTAPPLDPTGADRRLRLVYSAVPDEATAARLGLGAVERRLAACANWWPIASAYWWKGQLERPDERALWFKTSPKKLGALFRYLEREHPYEVPDILEVQVSRAHEPYIAWMLGTIDPDSIEGGGKEVRRSGSPKGRAARSRPRTPARRRLP